MEMNQAVSHRLRSHACWWAGTAGVTGLCVIAPVGNRLKRYSDGREEANVM